MAGSLSSGCHHEQELLIFMVIAYDMIRVLIGRLSYSFSVWGGHVLIREPWFVPRRFWLMIDADITILLPWPVTIDMQPDESA